MNYGQNIKFKLDYRINRLGGLSQKLSSLKSLLSVYQQIHLHAEPAKI